MLIPDNLSPVITDAEPVNPTFTLGWLDYAQARGFYTDPARVRRPRDKPRVERVVPYVRENFWGGDFVDLADAQRRVEAWCASTAGLRVHGTHRARPAELFAAAEATAAARGRRPLRRADLRPPKVARDHHVEVARALYSLPGS